MRHKLKKAALGARKLLSPVNVILVVLIVAAVGGACWLSSSRHQGLRTAQPPQQYVIEARGGGFFPSRLTIFIGDTVTFKNSDTKDVWPASDPHPTHEYLPGFDPRTGIAPGNSWTYTFTESGTWRFHNHLDPISQGEVDVLATSSKAVVANANANGPCDGKCFDDLIRKTVEEKGIDAAYALFQESFDAGTLPRSCHWTAHKIGEEAYQLFKAGKDFAITKATSYCAYGFYHGFMEGLLRDNPDPTYALSFCKKVEDKLGAMGLQNCYHGIGHGYTEDPPDPRTEGNFQAMIDPGIKMCEFLFGKNFSYLSLCLSGVFTVPAGFAAANEYGLSIDPKHPFAFCDNQPERYLRACYGEFAPKLGVRLGDIKKLPPFVDQIKDERLKQQVVWVVPSVMMSKDIQLPNHSRYIDDCRASFNGQYRKICWGGTILGFFSQGKPEMEYVPALAFCASKSWQSEDERVFCYGETFREMRRSYATDKMQTICTLAPEKYRTLCFDPEGKIPSPYNDPSFDLSATSSRPN